jgi:hypothetical protein
MKGAICNEEKILDNALRLRFLILVCDSGCQAATVNVGQANKPIMLVDSNGQNAGVVVSDASGDISAPCGQQVGIGQVNQEKHLTFQT